MHDTGGSAGEYRGQEARPRGDAVQSRRRARVVGVDGRVDRRPLRPGSRGKLRQTARRKDAGARRRRSPWKIDRCVISAARSKRRNLESRAKNARYTRTLTFTLSLTGRGGKSAVER